ncbi:hypothetical protein Trydic_g12333 [Trypoxylus dichotomus]
MELLIDITCIIGALKSHTGCVSGEIYPDFLGNGPPQLLEDLSVEGRQNTLFHYDGCSAHYSVVAREALDRDFTGRWIGRANPINWPTRSSNLTSPDFFIGIPRRQSVPRTNTLVTKVSIPDLDTPVVSPDMNLVENVWDYHIMVRTQHVSLVELQGLQDAFREEWKVLNQTYIRLIKSMPN